MSFSPPHDERVSLVALAGLAEPPDPSATVRLYLISMPKPNGGSLSSASVVRLPSRVEHSGSRIGKKMAMPVGTVMLRVTVKFEHGVGGSGQKLPARNQTLPDCPCAALAPVKSFAGLIAFGIEKSSSWSASCPPGAYLAFLARCPEHSSVR